MKETHYAVNLHLYILDNDLKLNLGVITKETIAVQFLPAAKRTICIKSFLDMRFEYCQDRKKYVKNKALDVSLDKTDSKYYLSCFDSTFSLFIFNVASHLCQPGFVPIKKIINH